LSVPEVVLDAVEEIERQIERHKETNWRELNPDIRAFCIAFIMTPSPRKAAIEAGIDPSRGARLYRDPIARAYISYLQEIQAENSIINAQFLDAHLLNVLPILMGEEEAPTVIPGVGLLETKRFYPAELLRLFDMMGKSSGYYNKDLSQGSLLGLVEAMQETGRRHQLEISPVDPKQLRAEADETQSST